MGENPEEILSKDVLMRSNQTRETDETDQQSSAIGSSN